MRLSGRPNNGRPDKREGPTMTNLKDKAAAPPAPRYGSKRPAPPGVGPRAEVGRGESLASGGRRQVWSIGDDERQ